MMLRPRDDMTRRCSNPSSKSRRGRSRLAWTRDIFGNHVATAHFADRAAELRFESNIRVDHAPADFRRRRYRGFCPKLSVCLCGGRLARPRTLHRGAAGRVPRTRSLERGFPRARTARPTPMSLLVDMTQTIRRTFKHVARHEKGIQDPLRTLELGQRQLSRPCDADDRGAALARNRRAVRLRISASCR